MSDVYEGKARSILNGITNCYTPQGAAVLVKRLNPDISDDSLVAVSQHLAKLFSKYISDKEANYARYPRQEY